jgi:hypothetical protein
MELWNDFLFGSVKIEKIMNIDFDQYQKEIVNAHIAIYDRFKKACSKKLINIDLRDYLH